MLLKSALSLAITMIDRNHPRRGILHTQIAGIHPGVKVPLDPMYLDLAVSAHPADKAWSQQIGWPERTFRSMPVNRFAIQGDNQVTGQGWPRRPCPHRNHLHYPPLSK